MNKYHQMQQEKVRKAEEEYMKKLEDAKKRKEEKAEEEARRKSDRRHDLRIAIIGGAFGAGFGFIASWIFHLLTK